MERQIFRWSPFPFIRVAAFFIVGILLAIQFDFSEVYLGIIAVCVLTIILLLHFVNSGKFRFNGVLPLLFFIVIGFYRLEVQESKKYKNHLMNVSHESSDFLVRLDDYPTEKDSYIRYAANILGMYENDSLCNVTGKISLYLKKDSITDHQVRYGDVLAISKAPFLLTDPKNPNEFNYRQYMSYQQIHHQVFLGVEDYKIIDHASKSKVIGLSFQIRDYFKSQIEKFVSNQESRAIAFALILGIKDEITQDLKQSYSSAGAMHVLAVSGLHVGIIFMIISNVFGFFKRWKYGRYLLLVVNLFFLWGYAFITGLSPSVMRAVVMFSIVLIGQSSARYANIYNSLAFSAILILLYDPYMIMRVGFQLSYLAVLGIVYIQPKIYALYKSKYLLLDKAWSITCVSLAAQIATFPLSLYYFHQFPTYFLASNLVVIPMAFGILLTGILLVTIGSISSFVGSLIGELLSWGIELLNRFVHFINSFSYSLIDWLNITFPEMLLFYTLFFFLLLMFHYRDGVWLKYVYLSFFALVGFNVFQHQIQSDKQGIIFYELRNNGGIELVSGLNAELYLIDKEEDFELLNYQLGPNRLASYQPRVSAANLNNVHEVVGKSFDLMIWKGKRIVIVKGKIDQYNFKEAISCEVLVISNNAIRSIEELSSFDYKELIIDSSNNYYSGKRLSEEAQKLGKEAHFIKEKAYIKSL